MTETKRLTHSSEVFVVNATGLSVDVYVNYEAQPTISDPKPLVGEFANEDELTPKVFVVKGETARPYGAYTFSVRRKGDQAGDVLAAASIELQQGKSFSGVFHETSSGGHQFSIYENDLSDATNARLTVRHVARAPEVSWELKPNGEDPRIPADERSGSLRNAEWQLATDVTTNDYIIEFAIDGARVAAHPDLGLAKGKNIIVYLIGHPQASTDEQLLLRPVAYQELEFDPGPVEDDMTTAPAAPAATSDQNAPLEFDLGAVEIWETNSATAEISAVDPDGVVTNLSVDRVDPKVGGIDIPGGAFTPSPAIGEPAFAEVSFKSDIPEGAYEVWIVANRGSLAQNAVSSFDLTVKAINIARLEDQVSTYQGSGDIEDTLARALLNLLSQAEQNLNAGDTAQACLDLKEMLHEIGSEKGKAITDRAADDLTRETKALSSGLGCG